MEPLELRGVPAPTGPAALVWPGLLVAAGGWMVWQTGQLVLLGVRTMPSDPARFAPSAVLLAMCVALTGGFLVVAAPALQLLLHHVRGRGRPVLVCRLDGEGWWFLQAGTRVLLPWPDLAVRVVSREPGRLDLRLDSGTVQRRGRDPLSWHVARRIRARGLAVPVPSTGPSEAELAEGVRRLSGGRVTVG